jgi:hypothetical protein
MKLRRVILILLFLQIFQIACWHQEHPYFQFNSFSCLTFKDDALTFLISSNDTISTTQTYFKLTSSIQYVAQRNLNLSNNAYGFKKPGPGDQGLKDKLSSIKIYSNNTFNGRAPSTDLKDIFTWDNIQWDGQEYSIDSLKNILNKEEPFLGQSDYFFKLI